MIDYSKVTKDISQASEFSHLLMNQNKQQEPSKGLLNSRLKLEEMITLGVLKSSNNSVVKKMLHAPTLKVYAVKEEPINNKEVRKNIKEWVTYWQNQFNE